MNKKALLLVSMSTLAACAACFSIVTATVSWFRTFENKDIDGSGSTFNSYFAGGDGSQADPYQISNSTQMYNFAWLQYMGVFNKDADNNGVIDQQYYFVLNNDVNMSGMVVPPIGTVKNPFLGNFNGNDYVISNLTVSNEIDTTQVTDNKIYYHPDGVLDLTGTSEVSQYGKVEILGFFGVIGSPVGYTGCTYSSSILSVSNFYLDKVTINSRSMNTLAGIVAGYVGANEADISSQQYDALNNVGVYQSNMNFLENARGLDGTSTLVSKYSLIGDYDSEAIEWNDNPSEGQDQVFGGSINIRQIARRTGYILGSSSTTFSGNLGINTNYKLRFNAPSGGTLNWNPASNPGSNYFDYKTNTALPFNVSTESVESPETTGNSKYGTNEYYNSHTSEDVLNSNGGYLVGGGTDGSDGAIRLRVQSIVNTTTAPWRSFNPTSSSNPTYEANKFEMVTANSAASGQLTRIQDNENASLSSSSVSSSHSSRASVQTLGLQRYYSVKESLGNTFAGAKAIYGIRFMQMVDTNSKTTQSNITVNGTKYENGYQFINSAINFSLKVSGYMTAVGAVYPFNTSNGKTFKIYSVTRDSTGAITNTTHIENVWKKSTFDGSGKESISDIKFNQTSLSGYTKAYDESWYNTNIAAFIYYYMEVPLPVGDYLLGGYSTSSYNAYLCYLDLGSNGSASGTTKTVDIKNVKFVASKNNLSEYISILFELSFATETHSNAYIYFKRLPIDGSGSQTILIHFENIEETELLSTVVVSHSASASTWNNSL